ncbi:MAG: LLM class flavin-dependent oxidoreductase [Proteobacteria bacterium]|nr:LLM class flavin-dependent oxidoreductase [Pseudomonadota bacterium]
MLRLSVLDQSPVRQGATPSQAIRETIDLAKHCDRLGYHRYWLAEHHGTPGLAGSTPEVLIPAVAGATERIRAGSGGVMLSHYSPYKVAENFRMLETLFPGRIDLGIGRAPGGDRRTIMAMSYGTGGIPIELYPRQVSDLIGFLANDLEADNPFRGMETMPTGQSAPALWMLGSSGESARVAAYFGCPYSFAHFITDQGGVEAMAAYRDQFRPSSRLAAPEGSIGVFVLCAETEEEARHHAASRDLWRLRLERGELGPFPPPEEALAYDYSAAEMLRVEENRRRQVVGDPAQCRARLEAYAESYGVDEVVVVTITHDFAARIRSYEFLAEVFGMGMGMVETGQREAGD